MPLVTLVPSTREREAYAEDRFDYKIRSAFKTTIMKHSGFGENDVQVFLLPCPYLNADPYAAGYILFIDTCPHEGLEKVSDAMVTDLAKDSMKLGLSTGKGIEIWPRFLPGPWAHVIGDTIVELVSHPRIYKVVGEEVTVDA